MRTFSTYREWKVYVTSAFRCLSKGLLQILWSVVIGMVSVVVGCYNKIAAFGKREPVAMFIVGFMLAFVLIGWTATFVNGRIRLTTTEHQRDSISYKYHQLLKNHGYE